MRGKRIVINENKKGKIKLNIPLKYSYIASAVIKSEMIIRIEIRLNKEEVIFFNMT